MGDFKPLIGPGLGVVDQLIDKHFDKLPNSAFRPETYKPSRILKSRRDSKASRHSGHNDSGHNDADRESDRETQTGRRGRDRRHTHSTPRSEAGTVRDHYYSRPTELSEGNLETHDRSMTRAPPNYGDVSPSYPSDGLLPVYSHAPPTQRPEYIPENLPPPPMSTYYDSRPPRSVAMDRGRHVDPQRDDDYYSDTYHAPRRPKAVTRRSSSYHGPRSKGDYAHRQQVTRHQGRGGDQLARMKEFEERYKLKDDLNNMFTSSPEGLVGGAAGAALGGWAAQKAQLGYAKKGSRREPNPLLTLIGATVGGLAVNSLVDRMQDNKKEAAKKEKKWEEKFGTDDESDDGRSRRSSYQGQGSRSHHRRRRDSYD